MNASARGGKRRLWLLWGAVSALVVAIAGAVVLTRGPDSTSAGENPGGTPLPSPQVVAEVDLPAARAQSAAAVDGSLWVVVAGRSLAEVNPASGEVIREVRADLRLGADAVGVGDDLWVAADRAGVGRGFARLRRGATAFDPLVVTASGDAVGGVASRIEEPLSSGPAGLWGAGGDAIVRIDPGDGRVVDRVALPFAVDHVGVGADVVWAASADGRHAIVTATTGDVTDGPRLATGGPLAVIGPDVWVVDIAAAEVVQLSARDGQERARTPLPGGAAATTLAAQGRVFSGINGVWVEYLRADEQWVLAWLGSKSQHLRPAVDLGTTQHLPPLALALEGGVWVYRQDGSAMQHLAFPQQEN